MKLYTLIIVLCLIPGSLFSAELTEVILKQYGLFEETSITSDRPADKRETLIDEVLVEVKSRHIETTDVINAEIGVLFGIEFEIVGKQNGEKVEIEIMHQHPPIVPPGKQPISMQNYFVHREIGKIHHALFLMENEWEVVEGAWIIKINYKNKTYLEKQFALVKNK